MTPYLREHLNILQASRLTQLQQGTTNLVIDQIEKLVYSQCFRGITPPHY